MSVRGIVGAFVAQADLPVAPPPDYGLLSSVQRAGLGEQAVMGILLVFSVMSWGIIAHKWRQLGRAGRQSDQFLEAFWGTKRLDAIYTKAESLGASPVAQVFRAGYVELSKLRQGQEGAPVPPAAPGREASDLSSIERALRRSAASELTGLEALVPFLATTGAVAPFVGLLGTVIGIISAFREIGAMGNANLATVAPGIGGALVATACGLIAAIPAVFFYNTFLARIRVLDTEMAGFSSDFLNIVRRHFF